MSVNGINNGMTPRMSTNLTVDRQSARSTFGERVQAGMNNVAGAVTGGLGTVAGMVGGGGIVSAAVSTVSTFGAGGTPGSTSQYSGLANMGSGVTGVPTINTTVGGGGGSPGFVGGGTSSEPGVNLAAGALGGAGGPTGGVGSAVASDPTLNAMFSEQKKLLGLQASISAEANRFNALSNVMKSRADAQKNAIQNVR
ncbi:hypothetical protein P2318_23690 [Myxococcaceae bacterium GXIMD 01537]